MAQDSARPEFWESRYRGAVTPWDAGGVPPALAAWSAARQRVQSKPGRVLVPGCGTGYEVRFLHQAGWQVLAIDFSPAAVEAAQRELGTLAHLVHQADFFDAGAPVSGAAVTQVFDALYERAFLCALPRTLWPAWAARTAEVLRPGGLLFGFFFLDDNAKGPPFGIGQEALAGLLDHDFECIEDQPVPEAQSLPVFRGRERWQVWIRKR